METLQVEIPQFVVGIVNANDDVDVNTLSVSLTTHHTDGQTGGERIVQRNMTLRQIRQSQQIQLP